VHKDIADRDAEVKFHDDQRAEIHDEIDGLESALKALPRHERGIPFLVFLVLAAVAVVLEYIPAKFYTQVFFDAGDAVANGMVYAFTTIGVLVAACGAELLRRWREPREKSLLELIFAGCLFVAVGAFLYATFLLRNAAAAITAQHAARSMAATSPIDPTAESLALTLLAALAILIGVFAGTFRESMRAFNLARELGAARSRLATNQKRSSDMLRDLRSARLAAGLDAGTGTAHEGPTITSTHES
jgi:hypothetical protein